MITEQQYQRLMKTYTKTAVLSTAAIKAGMHRETAAKYLASGQGPQPEKTRGRRRPDTFALLFDRPIDESVFGLATGESHAHLVHLVATGRAKVETIDGVGWYSAV